LGINLEIRDGRWIGDMVIYVCVKFNYDRLRIEKALGNCRKSDGNEKNKNNIRSAWGPFPGPNKNNIRSAWWPFPGPNKNNIRSACGPFPGPNKNNIRSAWGPFPGPRNLLKRAEIDTPVEVENVC